MTDLNQINAEQVAAEIEAMMESAGFRVFWYVMMESVRKARGQIETLGDPSMTAEQIGLQHMYWKGWNDCGKVMREDLDQIANAVRSGKFDWRKVVFVAEVGNAEGDKG